MPKSRSLIHDDFLLTTKQARELYHRFAKSEPIYDYHCHLPPDLIDLIRRSLGGELARRRGDLPQAVLQYQRCIDLSRDAWPANWARFRLVQLAKPTP